MRFSETISSSVRLDLPNDGTMLGDDNLILLIMAVIREYWATTSTRWTQRWSTTPSFTSSFDFTLLNIRIRIMLNYPECFKTQDLFRFVIKWSMWPSTAVCWISNRRYSLSSLELGSLAPRSCSLEMIAFCWTTLFWAPAKAAWNIDGGLLYYMCMRNAQKWL
jgi:hypothetical protein